MTCKRIEIPKCAHKNLTITIIIIIIIIIIQHILCMHLEKNRTYACTFSVKRKITCFYENYPENEVMRRL